MAAARGKRVREAEDEEEAPAVVPEAVEIPLTITDAAAAATTAWFPPAGGPGPVGPPPPPAAAPPAAVAPAAAAVAGDYFPNKARADGIHDFGVAIGPRSQPPNGPAFDHGVERAAAIQLNEDQAMDATFVGAAAGVRRIWEGLPDGGFVSLPPVQTGHGYVVTKVVFKTPTGWKVGRTLVNELGIGTGTAVLQVDFNHHGFLQKLTQGPAGAGQAPVAIGYIWSAATVNDPASKTPPTDSIFSVAHPNGVILVAHQQTSGATCFRKENDTYYSPDDPTANFVSEYDVELSGIIRKDTFGGRRGKDSVSLKFTKGKNIASIDDSKSQNSPNALLQFIQRLLGRAPDDKTRFEISSKWQQKRSGDWFQAIHAAILPTLNLAPPLPPNAIPYFVSHDGIAISYALEMGVNCLFLSGDNIYVFAKAGANTAQQDAACRLAISDVDDDDFDNVVNWFTEISARRQLRLNALVDVYRGHIAVIDAFIAAAVPGATVRKPLPELDGAIRGVLQAAVRYVFIEKLLPDAVSLFRELADGGNPCVQVTAYRTLKRLYEQHDQEPYIPETILGTINRSAVGKALGKWNIEQTLIGRLVAGLAGNVEDRDAYIFLPYIQNSANVAMKNDIAGAFQRLHQWLRGTRDLQPIFTENPGPNRQKRIKMSLNGLLMQVMIFLKTAGGAAGDQQLFTDSLAPIADAPATEKDIVIPATNVLMIDNVIDSYDFRQAVPDAIESAQSVSGVAPKRAAPPPKTNGGFRDNKRFIVTFSIDSYQCAEPILYAHVDVGADRLKATFALLVGQVRQGGRRALYGGKGETMTSKEDLAKVAHDVIYVYVLIGLTRVLRDVGKLRGAPNDVLEYYARCTAFMLLLLEELPPTPENALAVYDLMSHCSFMKNEDIAKALSVDVDTAGVYRLFFSSLEECAPLRRPENPAQYLVQASDIFASIWQSIPDIELNAGNVELIALEGVKVIRESYGLVSGKLTSP